MHASLNSCFTLSFIPVLKYNTSSDVQFQSNTFNLQYTAIFLNRLFQPWFTTSNVFECLLVCAVVCAQLANQKPCVLSVCTSQYEVTKLITITVN